MSNAVIESRCCACSPLLQVVRSDAAPLTSLTELQAVATSLFVAAFEAVFVVRLNGVHRNPQTM